MKSIFIKVTLLIVLTFVGFGNTFAQTQSQTVYEKKLFEITAKYFSIFYYGYNKQLTMSERAQLQVMTGSSDAKSFILGLGLVNYMMNHTETEAKRMVTQFENELKAAEKLKTAVDFKREKEKKVAEEQAKKEKQQRELQAVFDKSARGSIQKNIKSDFQTWSQKGEFEKQADFEERLQNQSQNKFIEICIEKIKSKINNINTYDLDKELLKYDSENEFFPVSFRLNGSEWQNRLKIPINDAEDFKENWNNLRWQENEYDWCFVENNLLPTKIILQGNNTKYTFNIPLQNQQEISFVFNDLEIENPYLKDFVFNYSTAKEMDVQIAKEKQIRDSVEFVTYNNKLVELVKTYNQQLLQNPYNIDKIIITDSYQLSRDYFGNKEELENNFKDKSNSIKYNFESLNDFENTLKRKNPTEFFKIFYSLNPDKKNAADKQYLECKCQYTTREQFDMDFINDGLYNCNCRSIAYQKNGNLFADKEEFDSYFDKGEDIYTPEIEKRQIFAFIQNNKDFIETMDFQKEKSESLGFAVGRSLLGVAIGSNIQKLDYSNENKAREQILLSINSIKGKAYYSQTIDLVLGINKKLNKEYGKNSGYFENNVEFYESFISENYKEILKEKKKK